MDDRRLGSSSEDEYDVYLNSVAVLKALQNEVSTNNNDNLKGNTKTNSKRKGRRTRQSLKDCESNTSVTEDVEIVSVEENLDKKKNKLRTDTRKEANDLIILDCNSDEDVEKYENYDVNVKILWQSRNIHRFNIHNHENFRTIFQHFADMENVSIEQILITKKDKPINITDTPSSIGLSIIDILEGGIIDANLIAHNKHQNPKNIIEENICQIKVQTANKESLMIPLKKNQQFKILIVSCARKWNVSESSIKLYFDGEPINANDTPESLDLEQEACIDLRISTK